MKKTVFISSTFVDLKNYRKKIWDLLNTEYDVKIKGMEDFGARKESPLETCLSEVEQCDIYVGIIGTRLGSVHKDKGKSFTQLEYERALQKDKEILIYIINEDQALVPPKFVDKGDNYTKLSSFKEKLSDTHTVDFFVDEDDLKRKVERKFDELLVSKKKNEIPKDKIKYAQEIIEEFKLFPSTLSGREIKLKGKFKQEYYPASKDICRSFNRDYGETVIVEVELIAPDNGGFFDKILISSHQFKKIKEFIGKEIEFYANLLFTEDTVDEFKAYFRKETTNRFDLASVGAATFGYDYMSTEIHEREGTIILSLNEFINND